MTFAHCFKWYLFYGKIVQIQLLALVLIHTPVKMYVLVLVQKSQILHYIFYINGQEKKTNSTCTIGLGTVLNF
jgi:hypothetical protein